MTNALLRLAFARAPVFATLTKPLPISRRLILQQERSQTLNRSPTACKLMVSCSISLPSRGSFHLSLAYEVVLADSHGISRAPCYSGYSKVFVVFDYKTFTFYGIPFQIFHLTTPIFYYCPTTPIMNWFRLIPFRSPLLRESFLLSFPPDTKMFQFSGFALSYLYIQ